MERARFLSRLVRKTDSKIVLLVLDGVGDLRSPSQPASALDRARLPNLDTLAGRSSLGRLDPVAAGVTPGSGPGHLGLFGYDPSVSETDIGRGVLEALGLGLEPGPGVVAVRGNFATADADGILTDRRAGRPSTEECRRLCDRLSAALAPSELSLEVAVHAGEGHRFVLLLRGEGLSAELEDTDPQRTGVAPLPLRASSAPAEETVRRLQPALDVMLRALAAEPRANRLLLRGFSKMPELPSFAGLYRLDAGAFAGYPLYRGVAAACGMQVVECGKHFAEIVEVVAERWADFDFFFLHVKQTDQAGEDGDLQRKVEVLEEVDRDLPTLLALEPAAIAITGDHSTPAPMKAHSWHPVPLLLHSAHCFVDEATEFTEVAALHGAIGTRRSEDLIGLLLAHAGKLDKFGA